MLHKLKPGKKHGKLTPGDVIDLSPTAAVAFKDKFERYEEQTPLPILNDAPPADAAPVVEAPKNTPKSRKGNR